MFDYTFIVFYLHKYLKFRQAWILSQPLQRKCENVYSYDKLRITSVTIHSELVIGWPN